MSFKLIKDQFCIDYAVLKDVNNSHNYHYIKSKEKIIDKIKH